MTKRKITNSNSQCNHSTAKNPKAIDRPIALVGLMGSGKSIMGRSLAKHLKLDFVDSDHLVTKKAGISIVDIFDLAGESKFREMEFDAIQSQINNPPHILATGGGAFCEARTAKLLLDRALVVWLQASPETLLNRIGDIISRPLLQTESPLKTLEDLLQRRKSVYKKAHIHLDTNGLSTQKSLASLIEALDTYELEQ